MLWRESSKEVKRARSRVAIVAKTRCQQVRRMAVRDQLVLFAWNREVQ